MKQKYHACDALPIYVGQHPVTQCAGSPAIDLLAQWISHHDGDAEQPNQSGEPTHCHPTAGEHGVVTVFCDGPADRDREQDGDCCAGYVPGPGKRIALVNVPAHCMSLIAKDKTLRWSHLVEVLDRIYAHECSRRTIFFARISFAACAWWVEW